jgi:hypothetical protein
LFGFDRAGAGAERIKPKYGTGAPLRLEQGASEAQRGRCGLFGSSAWA